MNSHPTQRDCVADKVVCEVCTWQPATFSECSATCDTGTQIRDVTCLGSYGSVCDDSQCDGDKPATVQVCELGCCVTYSWHTSAHGACSVTCGTGTRSREVFCHDSAGLVVDAAHCESLGDEPAVDESCVGSGGETCPTYSWTNGDWTDCSSTCGAGHRARDVSCVSTDGTVVDSSFCDSSSAPASTKDCELCACEDLEWETSSWSTCSEECGIGFKERTVSCRSSERGYVPFGECVALLTTAQPADHESCKDVCYSWVAADWGDCSSSGLQSRNVYCVSTDGDIDDTGAYCTDTQPATSESC